MTEELEQRVADAILATLVKLSGPDEYGAHQHVDEMIDGSVCIDGCFDLREVARAAIEVILDALAKELNNKTHPWDEQLALDALAKELDKLGDEE